MPYILLPHQLAVLVDDEDFDFMNQWNWHIIISTKPNGVQQTPQIVRHVQDGVSEFGLTLLQYDKEKEYLTFRNHNRLDYRRENLFLIPIEFAKFHNASHTGSSSRYKGVSYIQSQNRFVANLTVDGQKHYIGSSKDEDEAARLYNAYTKALFGDYAFQNIIGEDNRKPVFRTQTTHQPRKAKTSLKKWRGVFDRPDGFQASIKGQHLGTFHTAEDAAYAYNQQAQRLYGDKAILNELPDGFVGNLPKNHVTIDGQVFPSLEEVARFYEIPTTTLHNRMKKMTLEEAVAMGKAPEKLRVKGSSLRQLAHEHQVNRHTLSKLIRAGHTIEEAIQLLKQKQQQMH